MSTHHVSSVLHDLPRCIAFLQAELKFSWELGAYGEGKEAAGWRNHPEGEKGGGEEKGKLVRPSSQQALQ